METAQAALVAREMHGGVYMEHDNNNIALKTARQEESKACDDKAKQRRQWMLGNYGMTTISPSIYGVCTAGGKRAVVVNLDDPMQHLWHQSKKKTNAVVIVNDEFGFDSEGTIHPRSRAAIEFLGWYGLIPDWVETIGVIAVDEDIAASDRASEYEELCKREASCVLFNETALAPDMERAGAIKSNGIVAVKKHENLKEAFVSKSACDKWGYAMPDTRAKALAKAAFCEAAREIDDMLAYTDATYSKPPKPPAANVIKREVEEMSFGMMSVSNDTLRAIIGSRNYSRMSSNALLGHEDMSLFPANVKKAYDEICDLASKFSNVQKTWKAFLFEGKDGTYQPVMRDDVKREELRKIALERGLDLYVKAVLDGKVLPNDIVGTSDTKESPLFGMLTVPRGSGIKQRNRKL